ncbi:hypothetical protein [Planomonospora sp. ID82291]|uniref:hypothetical protein n=1 Tax=Planomonospora sp. ID82291 TaxID=2738136 RepID=UPI0018C44782|nr:hypothetical protein [Planomonospora sp. ID82291]MBG0818350.1 hypothetical protein [Planomonospora sp. ID82291]
MSRIRFTSPSGQAELLGSEYAHLGLLCRRIALGLLDLHGIGSPVRDRLWDLTPANHTARRYRTGEPGWLNGWASAYRSSFFTDAEGLIVFGGCKVSTFELALNTALQVGSAGVKLAARVYGQAEIHAFVEGPNRAWLAGVIDQGLAEGVLRRGFRPGSGIDRGPVAAWVETGWAAVTELLRARDDEPVVLSSTLGDTFFPSAAAVGWRPLAGADLTPPSWRGSSEWENLGEVAREEYREATVEELFGDLDPVEKWRVAMDGLRRRSQREVLELAPDGWDAFRYGHRLSVLDLGADDWRERLASALDVPVVL